MTMRTSIQLFALPLLLLFSISLFSIAAANPFIVDTLQEGDEAIILSSGLPYRLKLINVADTTQRAVFSLNGEYSRALRPRERYTFSDGSILALGNILPNEGVEINGKDIVEYYFIGSGRLGSPSALDASRRFTTALSEQFDLEYDLESLEEEGFPLHLDAQAWPQANPGGLSKPPLEPLPGYTEGDQTVQTNKGGALAPVCSSDTDCDDGDGCTTDACMGNPRRCTHQRSMPGCSFGPHYCVPYHLSYLIPPDSGVYCSLEGTWIEQQHEQKPCTADYECVSGLCKDKACRLPLNSPSQEIPAEAMYTKGLDTPSSPQNEKEGPTIGLLEKAFLFLLAFLI